MTITVIGHVTQDTLIIPHMNWQVVNGLGGSLYTVNALASLTDEPIRLICNVGENIFDSVISSLKKFPNIDVSGIRKVNGNHLHCYILYASEYGTQYDEGKEVPISFMQIEPYVSDSDFILVSLMTGFDIELSTLQQIKQSANCPVYFDYHILALDRDVLGNRFLRRNEYWFEWCSSCNHLQLNQFEAESLSESPIRTVEDAKLFSTPILLEGVESVAITLGSNGSFVCWKDAYRVIHGEKIDASPVSNVIDTTGCGDVFASGFIVQYLKGGDYQEAYKFASSVAGIKCGCSGFDDFANVLLLSQRN